MTDQMFESLIGAAAQVSKRSRCPAHGRDRPLVWLAATPRVLSCSPRGVGVSRLSTFSLHSSIAAPILIDLAGPIIWPQALPHARVFPSP